MLDHYLRGCGKWSILSDDNNFFMNQKTFYCSVYKKNSKNNYTQIIISKIEKNLEEKLAK